MNQLETLQLESPLDSEIARAVQKLPRRQTIEDEVWELEDSDDGYQQLEYPTVWRGSRNALRPCNLAKDNLCIF